MRLKFEKGIVPEDIARLFVLYIREQGLIIGAVNMYIQTYDDNMKLQNTNDYWTCTPHEEGIKRYEADVTRLRRKKIKAVG